MSACDGIGYTLGSVILLCNLMSTNLRLLLVSSAFVVHPTTHEYVNGKDPLHSMHPCSWSLSNIVLTILWSFDLSGRSAVVPVLGFLYQMVLFSRIVLFDSAKLLNAMSLRVAERWGLIGAVPTVSICTQ